MASDVDNDLAYSAIMNTVFKSGGLQQIQTALQGTDAPIQALSSMIFTVLTMARESSAQANLDPQIWISAGGVVDRVVRDICQIADSMGIEGAADPQFGVQVKRAVIQQMRAEAQGGQGGMAQPPQVGPAPTEQAGPPPGLLAQAGGMQ